MGRRDKYPRVGRDTEYGGGKQCECCDRPQNATRRLDVQVSWFRGEDEVTFVCDKHAAMANEGRWRQFYAHYQSAQKSRKGAS